MSGAPEGFDIATDPRTTQHNRRVTLLSYAAWLIVGIVLVSGVVGGVHRGQENKPDAFDDLEELEADQSRDRIQQPRKPL